MKENQAKKMADPLEGIYAFLLPAPGGAPGVSDSVVGLIRTQQLGGRGAPQLALQEYDQALKTPSLVAPYLVTALIRGRIYMTCPTQAEMWDMIENHEGCIVAVRDFSQNHIGARVVLNGSHFWLRSFSTHGVATLGPFASPAPFKTPPPVIKIPRELGTLTLWVPLPPGPAVVPVASEAKVSELKITVQDNQYLDPTDGGLKGRGTYLDGTAVQKGDVWLEFAKNCAGTTNITSPMELSNPLIILDPGYWPAFYASAPSASVCTKEISKQFEALFATDLSAECTTDAFPVLRATLTHIASIADMMGLLVINGAPAETIKKAVHALRAILGPRLRAKKWVLTLVSESNSTCPPWYFREEKTRLAREKRCKEKASPSTTPEKKREHEEDDVYGH